MKGMAASVQHAPDAEMMAGCLHARAGLAQRIVSGDVPSSLQDRLLMALDMGALIAGAKYRCARLHLPHCACCVHVKLYLL